MCHCEREKYETQFICGLSKCPEALSAVGLYVCVCANTQCETDLQFCARPSAAPQVYTTAI